LIPPPPESIAGEELKVEYISVMAQAQKLVGVGTVERFAGFVGQAATFQPEILDKVDFDQMVDVYGDMTSVQPSIIRTDEAVAEMRQQRAQEQQQAQQMEMAQQGSQAAKNLSETKLDEDSALGAMLANNGDETGGIL
jgi:hypothetical protein